MRLYPFKVLLITFMLLLNACSNQVTTTENAIGEKYKSNEKAEIYLQLGVQYMQRGQRGDYDIALDRLKKALSIDPDYPDAHNAIAVLYERIGQTEYAKIHYEKAVALNPQDSDAQNNYGQFLCKQDRWAEADAAFMKALENPVYRTPEIPYINAALCASRSRNYDKAETYLRKTIEINKKFPLALYHLASLYYETKQYTNAREYLKRYLAIAKHTPQTLWLGIQIERALQDKNAEASYAMQLRSQFPDSEQTQLLNQSERQ
ncbi:type IV pilus biogenesis/stability protein PilW [Beggiatoa leptomitoformis]|uniref:Type IV pilus biogenesis/stability protein PilW n=1 Tax=Beggiatoa leptomitoformis TaxID=288004 RepID=A0A2N9YIP3_9GAMM|nr:type IV pilus biogenesis/stability protein PilW [Beggiatoa leptomitoformis]ALG67678.1 type IV pilus biogenesis/stability protein PilW [Beggiatoa leptomitoformis]AUI70086.1 type IV pilus biogenesis/stability protein PilW [Beggiatoa leptomitoformis]